MEQLIRDLDAARLADGSHVFNLHVRRNYGIAPDTHVIIPVHKFILNVRSPVFRAMTNNSMIEAEQGHVTIEDSTPEAIECLVSYMYIGRCVLNSAEHCVDVATAADKYGFEELVWQCEDYLVGALKVQSQISRERFVSLFNAAEFCNMRKLEADCIEFLLCRKQWITSAWNYPYFLSITQCQKVMARDRSRGVLVQYGGNLYYH